MEKEQKSFILYTDYINHISLLSDEDAGRLFKALFRFVEAGEIPQFVSEGVKICFSFMSLQIQRDKEKYIDICQKRAEAGRKGGKQKQANQANACFDTQEQTNSTDTDTDNAIVNATDISYICSLLNQAKRKVHHKGVLHESTGQWSITELVKEGVNIEDIKQIAQELAIKGYTGGWYDFCNYVRKAKGGP